MADPTTLVAQISGLNKGEVQQFAQELTAKAPIEARALTETLRQLDKPTAVANDKLWLIIIWAFAGVLGLTALVLSIGMFTKAEGSVKPELVFSLFTSVAGFLAGLLAPNPWSKDQG